jgi:hypothetical protein
MWLLTLQLFKNNIDTQGKRRLNLHSLSASELLSTFETYNYNHAWAMFVVEVYICVKETT